MSKKPKNSGHLELKTLVGERPLTRVMGERPITSVVKAIGKIIKKK